MSLSCPPETAWRSWAIDQNWHLLRPRCLTIYQLIIACTAQWMPAPIIAEPREWPYSLSCGHARARLLHKVLEGLTVTDHYNSYSPRFLLPRALTLWKGMAGIAGSRMGTSRLIASLPMHPDQYMRKIKAESTLQASAAEFQPKTDPSLSSFDKGSKRSKGFW